MTVTVSSLYNNTKINCRAQGISMNADSQVAVLTVQGTILSIVYEVRLLIYQTCSDFLDVKTIIIF